MKNADLWGDETKNLGFLRDETLNRVMYTQKAKKIVISWQNVKKTNDFSRDFWTINVHILHLRRRRKEISEIFLNKRSKIVLKKTILQDLVPNCGPLAGMGRTNPPNLPPTYAHAFSK